MQKNSEQKSDKTVDFDDVCNNLLKFFHKSKSIINERTATAKEVREWINYIVEIRSLLTQLEQYEDKLKKDESRVSSIEYLKECYLEFEGMVKEMRDDLPDQ